MKIVSDVEGKKVESLGDCLKWVKGLLKDFITLRRKVQDHKKLLDGMNQPNKMPPTPLAD